MDTRAQPEPWLLGCGANGAYAYCRDASAGAVAAEYDGPALPSCPSLALPCALAAWLGDGALAGHGRACVTQPATQPQPHPSPFFFFFFLFFPFLIM